MADRVTAAARMGRLKVAAKAGKFPTPEGNLKYLEKPKGRPKPPQPSKRDAAGSAAAKHVKARLEYERMSDGNVRRGLSKDEVKD